MGIFFLFFLIPRRMEMGRVSCWSDGRTSAYRKRKEASFAGWLTGLLTDGMCMEQRKKKKEGRIIQPENPDRGWPRG